MGHLGATVFDAVGRADGIEEAGDRATAVWQPGKSHIIVFHRLISNNGIEHGRYHVLPEGGRQLRRRSGCNSAKAHLLVRSIATNNSHKEVELAFRQAST